MTVTRKWSLLAAVLAVAIFVAGWFLLISPKRSEAATLRDKTVSQEEANSRLEQQISVLRAQQAELPQQRARLAVIKTRIPDNPALPTLIRNLTAAGRKAGVSLDTLAPSLPVAVVATPTAVAAPPPGSTSATGGTGTTGTTGDASAAPAVPTVQLFTVPLQVNVTGSYFELEQFLNKLEGLKRSFLVTGFTVSEASSEKATVGDLNLALQGRVFMSPPVTAATSATTTTTPATAAAPAPAGQ